MKRFQLWLLSLFACCLSCAAKEEYFEGCLPFSGVETSEGPMLIQMLTRLSHRTKRDVGDNESKRENVTTKIAEHLEKTVEKTGEVPKEQVVKTSGGQKEEDEATSPKNKPEEIGKAVEAIGRRGQKTEGVNVTEQNAPFAHAVYTNVTLDSDSPLHRTPEETNKHISVQVDIASSNDIVSVYLILYVPLIMAWVAWFHYGQQEVQYVYLLQFTFCATGLGNVLVNQSLCILMRAPMALTFIQAASLVVFGVPITWLLSRVRGLQNSEADNPAGETEKRNSLCILLEWSPAALCFAGFQLADHMLSFYTSLSERTVLSNLTPVLSLTIEGALVTFWASTRFESSTFTERMSVAGITCGVVVFALQYPDFKVVGVQVALASGVMQLLYRMVQRSLLAKPWPIPTTALVCYDGLVLVLPSLILSFFELPEKEPLWEAVKLWTTDDAIMIMILLSTATFFVGHWSAICLLRVSSVTSALVLNNLANGLCVISGIWFFGDSDFERPLAFVGILITIFGSMSYAYCSAKKNSVEMTKKAGMAQNTDNCH